MSALTNFAHAPPRDPARLLWVGAVYINRKLWICLNRDDSIEEIGMKVSARHV